MRANRRTCDREKRTSEQPVANAARTRRVRELHARHFDRRLRKRVALLAKVHRHAQIARFQLCNGANNERTCRRANGGANLRILLSDVLGSQNCGTRNTHTSGTAEDGKASEVTRLDHAVLVFEEVGPFCRRLLQQHFLQHLFRFDAFRRTTDTHARTAQQRERRTSARMQT